MLYIIINKHILVPYIPNIVERARLKSLYILIVFINSCDGKINPEIDEIAIIIIIIGDTIPAATAASPSINPPNIDIEDAEEFDILKSPSLNISKDIIINSASIYAGKGTNVLPALKINKRLNGTIL